MDLPDGFSFFEPPWAAGTLCKVGLQVPVNQLEEAVNGQKPSGWWNNKQLPVTHFACMWY